jgi:UDP-N-acetylmuramate--alanine ligase
MSAVEPELSAVEPELTDLGRVHLIGIGGAGMSAVAVLLAAHGVRVSGSDERGGPVLDALRAVGVDAVAGHDARHVDGVDTVVVSSAIRASNVELARARELGVRVLHRSEALALLMRGHRTVAVAGAHGKSTTSAMIAVALDHAGLEPSFAIGATVLGVPGAVGGARVGRGDVLVAEADESDGSFLNFTPELAVITNVEPDHLDHYGDAAAFEAAFVAFARRVRAGGWLVVCADDDGARRLAAAARREGRQVVTYGLSSDADVVLTGVEARSDRDRSGVVELSTDAGALSGSAGTRLVQHLDLAVPGEHNALNAAAAWCVCLLLGVTSGAAAVGLAAFRGTARRFDERGVVGGVRVVDDYAHHPTEVAALVRAARGVANGGRVLVLFQPHLYSRTRIFAAEFAQALQLADAVVVTEVYGAREDPEPGVTGALITDQIPVEAGAVFVADRLAAARWIADRAQRGDLLLTVGAGDVTELGPAILEMLRDRLGDDDALGART